jgi:hypothetical protein
VCICDLYRAPNLLAAQPDPQSGLKQSVSEPSHFALGQLSRLTGTATRETSIDESLFGRHRGPIPSVGPRRHHHIPHGRQTVLHRQHGRAVCTCAARTRKRTKGAKEVLMWKWISRKTSRWTPPSPKSADQHRRVQTSPILLRSAPKSVLTTANDRRIEPARRIPWTFSPTRRMERVVALPDRGIAALVRAGTRSRPSWINRRPARQRMTDADGRDDTAMENHDRSLSQAIAWTSLTSLM